jgi:hypothetical protein
VLGDPKSNIIQIEDLDGYEKCDNTQIISGMNKIMLLSGFAKNIKFKVYSNRLILYSDESVKEDIHMEITPPFKIWFEQEDMKVCDGWHDTSLIISKDSTYIKIEDDNVKIEIL